MKWCSNIYIYMCPHHDHFGKCLGTLTCSLVSWFVHETWNRREPVAVPRRPSMGIARSSTRKNLQSDLWPRSSIPLILIAILNQSVPRRPSMGKPTKDEEASEKIEITDFDDVLKHIGGWGPFQVGHQNWFTMCDIDYRYYCTTELLSTILQH